MFAAPVGRQRLVQGVRLAVVVDDLRLRVRLVEVGVGAQDLQLLLPPVTEPSQSRVAVRGRHPQQSPLGQLDGALAGPQHPLTWRVPGKRQVGTSMCPRSPSGIGCSVK